MLGFRELTCKKEDEVEAENLREVIEELTRRYGPRFRKVVLEGAELSRTAVVFVNGKRIIGDPSLVSLKRGDTVVFSTAYGGG